jgi:DNA polymerase elongation subunit (family B)
MVMKEGKGKIAVNKYLYEIKRDMLNGKYDNKLVITKKMSKDVSEFKVKTPQVKACLKAQELGGEFVGNVVSWVYVKGNGVEPILDGIQSPSDVEIDYDKYFLLIRKSVERFINSAFYVEQPTLF